MNFYPAYFNAAATAAAATGSQQQQVNNTMSDIEKFQYLAQTPFFMQNSHLFAQMIKILPKLANPNFLLKQATLPTINDEHNFVPSVIHSPNSDRGSKRPSSKRLDYSKLVEECTKPKCESMDHQSTMKQCCHDGTDNKHQQNTIIHQLQTKFSRFVKFLKSFTDKSSIRKIRCLLEEILISRINFSFFFSFPRKLVMK
jgi:hypothetical protein